jgi:hypothetical protein
VKPLHSKTASKAGSSLWIPSGRGQAEKTAKFEIRFSGPACHKRRLNFCGLHMS